MAQEEAERIIRERQAAAGKPCCGATTFRRPKPNDELVDDCRCQNQRISGRGSRTVRLGSMITGDGGHDVYPGLGSLYGGKTLRPA